MEDEIKQNIEEKKIPYRRHIPIKEDTWNEFIETKESLKFKSQDALEKELLRVYRIYRKQKEKQNAQTKEEKE